MIRQAIHLLVLGTFAVAVSAAPPSDRPGSPAKGPDDAETLFRKMENRFVKAETLAVTFDGVFEGSFQGRLKGTLLCTTGNKSREVIEGDLAFGTAAKKTMAVKMVSDGTKMASTTTLGANPQEQTLDTPKQLGAAHRLFMARAGVVCPTFLLAEHVRPGENPPELNPEEHIRVADFRLGVAEKVGGRDVRVLRYSLGGRTFKEPLAVTVWLDTKTELPLKRVVAIDQGGLTVTLTETYSDLTLDGKVDEKQFNLPGK